MASFRGHLAFASGLGFVYGGLGKTVLDVSPGTALLGFGLTTIGGLMPDLDSDSGVPVRELFGLASTIVPLMLMPRLSGLQLPHEEMILYLAVIYCFIRYGCARFFKRITVHRGMFHSIPAILIAGMLTYLAYDSPDRRTRLYFAGAVMAGFLSHLVLDEIYAVDFRGIRIKLNKMAGSAIKFASPSIIATLVTYLILGGLSYLCWLDYSIAIGRLRE